MGVVDVELLVVADCPHAAGALTLLEGALADIGLGHVGVRMTVIEDEADAAERGFTGSPTILLDGEDPFPAPGAPALACRIYLTAAGPAGVPALRDLRAALKRAAHASAGGAGK